MKKIVFILLLLAFVFQGHEVFGIEPILDEGVKTQFVSKLKGVWVPTEYIRDIEKNRSPLKSSKYLEGMTSIIIDGVIRANTMIVQSSWNNHEGGMPFNISFVRGQAPNSLKTDMKDYKVKENFHEIGYETQKNENFLFVYHYNKAKTLIDKKQYSKVLNENSNTNAAWGLQYIVNQKLIAGTYKDSIKKSDQKITFNSDGSITGLENFKTYDVGTDFVAGPYANLDQLSFDQGPNYKCFVLELKNGSINLYEAIENEKDGKLVQGKLKYKLTKIQSKKMSEEEIESEITKARYCSVKSDCANIGATCPFGCEILVNQKEANQILRLINNYDGPNSKCEYKCRYMIDYDCIEQKCTNIYETPKTK